jgi:hypothetical protein
VGDTSTFLSSGGPHVDPSLGHSAVPSIAGRPGSAMPQTRASGISAPSVHDARLAGPIPSQSPSIEPTSIPIPSVKPRLANNRFSRRAQEWNPTQSLSPKDDLRLIIARSTQQLHSSKSWSDFDNKCKDPRGDLHPDVLHLPHRASHLLNRLRVSGATVATNSTPWSLQQKLSALERGSHQSAKQHVHFLCGEFINMIKKG